MSKLIKPRWETPAPPGVAGSYGPAVIAWTRKHHGREPGAWQAYSLERALRHDSAGDLIARVVLLGTARQNGKTVIVQDLFGWLLDEGRHLAPFAGWTEMLAAAHDAKQARKMYERVRSDVDASADLASRIRTTKSFGIQAGPIAFDTVTGQPGSVRGSTAGAIAWDEVLTQKDWDMWQALAPTQSAQRSPIMFLTSTAGFADSVVLRAFYDRLVRIASGDERPDHRFYGAWWESVDPYAGAATSGSGKRLTAAEWKDIGRANPALGDGRLTRDPIILEHSILPADAWRTERLNHFVETAVPGAFAPGVWARLRTPGPLADALPPYVLGIDIQPGWDRATIAVAATRPDDRIGVEIYRDLRATDGDPVTAERIIAAVEAFPEIGSVQSIRFDMASGGAQPFTRAADSGLPWEGMKPSEVVAACMDVTQMILAGRLAVDDPLLDAQIAVAARRDVGQDGAFRFSRKESPGPIDAVLAMTFAAHAISFMSYPSIT